MTAAHASAEESLRSRVWSSVLAWATASDNAKTDFAAIGALNFGLGVTLAVWPQMSTSPMLAIVMDTLPRPAWAATFLVAAGLVWASLTLPVEDKSSGRLRHWAWMAVGTAGIMWLLGLLIALPVGGNLIAVLFAAAIQTWYTLSLIRLEAPLLAKRLAERLG